MKRLAIAISLLFIIRSAFAAPPQPPVARGRDGRLAYVADERGDRMPDYSYAGYAASEKPIPMIPARLQVGAPVADNTQQLQAAIDRVSQLPLDANGFRGAVLVPKGRYELTGGLTIAASGVVLRGSGFGEDGTTLVATGADRRTLVRIAGKSDRAISPNAIAVADDYVPVGAMQFHVKSGSELKPGDRIIIRRPSTKEWIAELHMDDLGGDRHGPSWRPGSRDIVWDRSVTKVEGELITIDAPITLAIDSKFGGATVATYAWPGRIGNVGVENIRLESSFDAANPKDEEHAWFAITIENAEDAWVRQVVARHFVGSAVAVWDSARRITVEDCKSLEPIGEIGGWRRNAFFTNGQQVLMQRLFSEDGRHDFAVGFAAAGPNAFVQCESSRSSGESGAIDSLACGALFDMVRIDGNSLSLRNRMYQSQGAGWSAANGTLWNCSASVIECWRMPAATNWAIGTWGEFSGDGVFWASNDGVSPDCLFYAQLADRIGSAEANQRAQLLLPMGDASSSPTPQVAAELIARSKQPGPRMSVWIDQASRRNPIPAGVEEIAVPAPIPPQVANQHHPLKVENGLLTINGAAVTGARHEAPWWNGSARPADLDRAPLAITRYVPGRIGPGLTDDLPQLVESMKQRGIVAIEQHPPLWYDRRRDDHERIRRADGDVVAPFYEHPFARTGLAGAWDGLSKYDLTKPNLWYWSRLRQFADLADANGLVLIADHYFQHSILEAGAHYADYPWRPVNNVNDTGFPEPPPFAGDKRIFMAEQFYDLSDSHRRELHRRYIRMNLDELAGKTNVIHQIGDEFTGPLHFAEFWIDTVGEWEREKNQKVIVALSATKDVQDAILADPRRAAIVDVIDIRYWWYQADGKLYAPEGGKNLAPRQWERVLKPKNASAESIARAVREYREKFPDKAVIYSANGAETSGAAILAAGGSLAVKR